jgi:HAD superfamily hydrolase (TIGR01484 family)
MHERVPAHIAQEVMEYCHERKLQLNFYYNGLVHTAEDTSWLQLYHSRTGSPYIVEPDMLQIMSGIEPTKLLIVDTPEYTNSLLPILRDRYQGVLYVTKTTDEYLEMMPPHANKGAALEYAANRLGITAARTIAIGDSFNDIPMVQWAGLGLAVGNAKPELRAVADHRQV